MLPPFSRLIIVLWAVAVAVTPGALAVADARIEAAALAATPGHVEALGGSGCAPIHDAECGVCSSLRLLARPSGRVASPAAPTTGSGVAPRPEGTHFATSEGWPERQPRAPPTV